MRTSTLWLLLALALGLAGAVLWQMRHESSSRVPPERPLLADAARHQVRGLRIDNLERGLQLRLELDAAGAWRIRDPIDAPASAEVVDQLLEQLTQGRGAPHRVEDLASVGLAPPRAVLEVQVELAGGRETRRLEIGAVDLDQHSMYVRVDGELLRAPRALEALLDRDLAGWRSTRIATFVPEAVIELRRAGRFTDPDSGKQIDLDLEALVDDGWRATAPFVARLEPGLVGALLVSLATLEAMSFVDDAGAAGLEHFDLDQPAVRLEVQTTSGAMEAFRLSPGNRQATWYCIREGHPQVFRVEQERLMFVLMPAPGFLDLEIVRTLRASIARVRLAADGREVLLEQEGTGWSVSSRRGSTPELARAPADSARVEDLLAGLESAKILEFLPGVSLPASLVEQGFRIEAGERTFGGTLGPQHRSSDGAVGLLFQREGDQLVGLVEERLLELVRTDPATLRSLQLHKLPEIDVVRIRVRGAGGTRQYLRNDSGQWSREGSRAEARDLAVLVDRLLAVRAQELLPRFDPNELLEPVEILLEVRAGDGYGFVLGRRPTGEPAVLYASRERFGVVAGKLHEDLLALLRSQ